MDLGRIAHAALVLGATLLATARAAALPDLPDARVYRSGAGACVTHASLQGCQPCIPTVAGNLRVCDLRVVSPRDAPGPAGSAVLVGVLAVSGGGHDGEPIFLQFRALAVQPPPAQQERPPNGTGTPPGPPAPATTPPVTWRVGEPTPAWVVPQDARARASARLGPWEIPAPGTPLLPASSELRAPIDRIMACWLKGAKDPTTMWHCSGLFVSHGDFAACMTGAYCVPPSSVPKGIRATGLSLVPYADSAKVPVAHLPATRASAQACLASTGKDRQAFAECFIPRQVPLLEALAIACAKTRSGLNSPVDPAWVGACATSAAGLQLQLPPAVRGCVQAHAGDTEGLRTCLATQIQAPSTYCTAFLGGAQDQWLSCLYEQAAATVTESPLVACLARDAQSQRPNPLACFATSSMAPASALTELQRCQQSTTGGVEACITRILLIEDPDRACPATDAADVVLCKIENETGSTATAIARCLRAPDADDCVAQVAHGSLETARALAACADDVRSHGRAKCALSRLLGRDDRIVDCMDARDVPKCLGAAVLGPAGGAMIECARGNVDLERCLNGAGIHISRELSAAWACRNAKSSDEALDCVAGIYLGEQERAVLNCARRARTTDDALLCLAESKLGKPERALLQCVRSGKDTKARLVCAIGTTVLGEKEAKALACAMRGDLVAAALCMSNTGLTPEQETAIACAASTGGEPISFASCVGAKLTLMELTKCVAFGVGTEGGCFGESNDLRRAVETAYHDLTQGLGPNNDLVKLGSALEESVRKLGDEVTKGIGNVLRLGNGAGVLIGETLQSFGNATQGVVDGAKKGVENACGCRLPW